MNSGKFLELSPYEDFSWSTLCFNCWTKVFWWDWRLWATLCAPLWSVCTTPDLAVLMLGIAAKALSCVILRILPSTTAPDRKEWYRFFKNDSVEKRISNVFYSHKRWNNGSFWSIWTRLEMSASCENTMNVEASNRGNKFWNSVSPIASLTMYLFLISTFMLALNSKILA